MVRSFNLKMALAAAAAILPVAGMAAFGTPTVDGTVDAVYGSAVSVQTIQTQFGDASSGLLDVSGGELDGLYLANDATNLYITLAGNVEDNFNAVVLLVDTPSGGVTTIPAINVGPFEGHFNTNGLAAAVLPAGFTPSYGFISKAGNSPLDIAFVRADFNAVTFEKTAADVDTGDTANPAIADAGVTVGSFTYGWALNNANTAGVSGGTALHTTPDPAAVTTGLEIAIPLAAIDNVGAGSTVKLIAMYTNGGGDFLSNQFLPPATVATGNVGNGNGAGGVVDFTIAPFAGYAPASYTIAAAPSSDAANWAAYE